MTFELPLRGNRCRCSACGRYFNSVYAFDLHRVGTYPHRRCLGLVEMLAKGMRFNDDGFLISEEYADSPRGHFRNSRDQD